MSGEFDVLRARVVFRDRTVADVLDLALRFIVVHARVYGRVALASLVPTTALSLLAGGALGWNTAWVVALPLAVAMEIPFTVLASQLVFQDDVRARDVLRTALRTLPRTMLLRWLALLLTAIATLFFVIPGLWIATSFTFLPEVTLLERAGIGRTFDRVQRIASSAATETLLGCLALILVPIASVLLADITGRAILGELIQFRPPPPVWTTGGSALATIGLFAQVPFLATARFLLYLDVRTRTEGWDIQTRFSAIAARSVASHDHPSSGTPNGSAA